MVSPGQLSTGISLVHECQIGFHRCVRKHRDILETQGLKDIAVQVVIQRQASDTLYKKTGPVYVDLHMISIFPT